MYQRVVAGDAVWAELADEGLAQGVVGGDEVLAALFQPGHPVGGGRAVAFGGVAGVAGQDEIPDLVEVTVLSFPGQEHEREHVIDGYPGWFRCR